MYIMILIISKLMKFNLYRQMILVSQKVFLQSTQILLMLHFRNKPLPRIKLLLKKLRKPILKQNKRKAKRTWPLMKKLKRLMPLSLSLTQLRRSQSKQKKLRLRPPTQFMMPLLKMQKKSSSKPSYKQNKQLQKQKSKQTKSKQKHQR